MAIATAHRMNHLGKSFVREILKAAANRDIISFAGGLPNPKFIPVDQISQEIQKILSEDGAAALQYYATEGYEPLRQWVADQYKADGLNVSVDQILITTGSQQGLDLIGKVLLDPGDRVIVEDPTYIAALQAFGMFEARFCPVPLDSDGIDPEKLQSELKTGAKIFYCMPNFQNPSGISYSAARHDEVIEILRHSSVVLVEDDPYRLLRFRGETLPPISCKRADRSILLGSFSKIIAPGMRLGWICAPLELMDKLIIAKQSADLHSENLGQRAMHRLVTAENFPRHLQVIRDVYRKQCEAMISAIKKYLPPEVQCTEPDGGMFLWITLPQEISAIKLFHRAIERCVAFVPGSAFHANGGGENTMRLNFSNSDEQKIEEGIRRLAAAMDQVPR